MADETSIDFWFTIGSTYTYLTVMRLEEVEKAAEVRFRWRPFDLRTIFNEAKYFPFPEGAPKTAYMWRDLERRAAMYGIRLHLPVAYPAKDSALANKIALLGMQEGWGQTFVRSAYRQWFVHGNEMGSPSNVEASLKETGQDQTRVLDLLGGVEIQQRWEAETDQARRHGIFGSPTFVVDGELFWGDDRLEDAVRWCRRVAQPAR